MKKITRKRAAYIKLTGRNSADSFRNLDQSTIFEDVALDSQIHRGIENVLFVMDREKDDIDRQFSLANFLCDCETVLFGHIDIHNRDLRPADFNLRHQIFAIACLRHHFHVRIGFHYLAKALEQERVIVGYCNADFTGHPGVRQYQYRC